MVRKHDKGITKNKSSKGFVEQDVRASKINASTSYGVCSERLSAFGGLLALIKFQEVFDHTYKGPCRALKLGDYRMVVGILMLLFIGLKRLCHFIYIRVDAMLEGLDKARSAAG